LRGNAALLDTRIKSAYDSILVTIGDDRGQTPNPGHRHLIPGARGLVSDPDRHGFGV